MKWIVAITASFILNLALIFLGRGNWLATILTLSMSFWVGLPLLILSAIFFGIGSRKGRFGVVGAWSLAIALVIFSMFLSIPIGDRILKRDMCKAKTFCESLIPALEQNKTQTGLYPKHISEILAGQEPPRFLPSWWYYSDGTNFDFTISDPGELMGGIEYMSQTKSWHYWD